MKRIFFALAVLALLCCACSALAYHVNSEGLYVDDSGKVIAEYWDDDAGIYILQGVAIPITDADTAPATTVTTTTTTTDGAMVVESSDGDKDPLAGVQQNPDGSITIESGQIQSEEPSTQGSTGMNTADWAANWAKYTAKNGTTTGTVYMDSEGNVFPAEILSLGLGRSTIRVDGQKIIVPTCSLRWDSNAPEDKALAVVTPSRQSYITLRAKKSSKSFVMGHCEKCTVLRVISTGKTWTMVDDNGVRGYVMTSGLTFYANTPRSYAAGIITVKGKTPSGNTVHVRSAGTRSARQIAEYPVGTAITVFAQDDEWSEIDVEGLHCYIQNKYVTLQEPLLIADSGAATGAED